MSLPSLEGCKCLAKIRTISSRPRTGARAFSLLTSETPERLETDHFLWDFDAARLGALLDLRRRAHRLLDDIVTHQAEMEERGRHGGLVLPGAHGAAFGQRVAGNGMAGVERLLSLVAQRCTDLFNRVDQVQAVGERAIVILRRAGAAAPRTARGRAAARCVRGRPASPGRSGIRALCRRGDGPIASA